MNPDPIDPERLRIENMEFANRIVGTRIKNILRENDISTLAALLECSEQDLLDMRNFGTVCLAELTVKLKRMNVQLRREDTW